MYHFVDYSSNFHVACWSPEQSTEAFVGRLSQRWISWAGTPGELVADSGREFISAEFAQFCQEHGIKSTITSVEAPWQNAKAERHGGVLKTMLSKYDLEHPIMNGAQLEIALAFCTQAKNACSLKGGYAPEVLVLGKHTKIAGSVASDDSPVSHFLSLSDGAEGLRFREKLARRETARRAFHAADNDMSLRRALLRRSCPHRGRYAVGEWVMLWRPGVGHTGSWHGPFKVVLHESDKVVWLNMLSHLHRAAPEYIRPVSSLEAREVHRECLRPEEVETRVSEPPRGAAEQFPRGSEVIPPSEGVGEAVRAESTSSQPDQEPSVPDEHLEASEAPDGTSAVDVPVPEPAEGELESVGLWCIDDLSTAVTQVSESHGWCLEVVVGDQDIQRWRSETDPGEMAFVADAGKKQRSEVKLKELSPAERSLFEKAKDAEIANWLKTSAVRRMMRGTLSDDEIIRCRWLLTWKPLDPTDCKPGEPTVKAKARLVILGYQDPQLTEVPRDSPTLSKVPRMIILQLIASMQWRLRSFDIKAAFLQGETDTARRIAVEPVPELARALKLKPGELCELTKGAYGLIDAPYMWFRTLNKELISLGFMPSPFDPCMYVLRHPETGVLSGVLGIHVDDGLGGGNDYFAQQVDKLERKFPFGSKKSGQFTYTGIELTQGSDYSITLSQSQYVRGIKPIAIKHERKPLLTALVTPEERSALRGLIGSLQYAATNTRPDLACRLSSLQSMVPVATVETLMLANKTLHEAKRHHDVSVVMKPIPCRDMRFIAFSDASFASPKAPDSRAGTIILGTHADIESNHTCPVSPLCWGSKKIQKVVTSTLAAETMALNMTMDQLSWIRLCWGWILDPNCQWQQPAKALSELPKAVSSVSLPDHSGDAIAATDCKSLYDLISRTAPPNCQEFRTMLHARSIKDMMQEGTQIKWVHSGAQLADSLTKIMSTEFLRETMRRGVYQLHDETEILKQRACARSRLQWLRQKPDQTERES